MLKWIFKVFAAVLIWVAAALLIGFLGTLLVTVTQAQIQAVGTFLKDNAGLIGFLFGAWYFVWGPVPIKLTHP